MTYQRRSAFLLILLTTAACGPGETEIDVVDSADAGGVEIMATSEMRGDSIRIATRITNALDTPADLILHGACPVTLVAYDDDRLLWDEREGRTCEQGEMPIPLAPGEYKMLAHSVPESGLDSLAGSGDYRLGVRIWLAQGPEYMIMAPLK